MARLVWRTGKSETVFRIFAWEFLSLDDGYLAFLSISCFMYIQYIFLNTSYLLVMMIDLH